MLRKFAYLVIQVFSLLIKTYSPTFLLAHNVLNDLLTFPQFGAKLISLYLFSVKNREKLPKN